MKDKYRELCATEKSIPIFSRDWWLDSVAGEKNWDVALVEKGGCILATLPYVIKKRYGFIALTHPPLTQTLGPWLRESDAKYAKKLKQQRDLMERLLEQLPRFDHYAHSWHYRQTNWLPFFWKGFEQTTLYTYILQDLSDEKALWHGLQENIRREIRKAGARFHLHVREDLQFTDFLDLNRMVFERKGMKPLYSEKLLKNLDKVCAAKNARKIFIAEDKQGQRHAGVYLIWDENSAYYLMGGSDPVLRNSGATSLCMWEAIKFASTVTRSFDFEGSMVESIERFFSAFGAVQTPYFAVKKTPSKLLKILLKLR